MRKHKHFFVLLLCAALLIFALPVNVSAADDFPSILAEAKKGVVTIYGLGDDGIYLTSWTGTGFAVGESGKDSDTFLTNWHVVTNEGEFAPNKAKIWILQENCQINENTLEPDPKKSITCEVLKTTTGYPDYAIIRATESIEGYKPLPLLSSKSVPDGLTVYALGYPGVVDSASANHYGIDDITSTNGIISQHMQYTAADNTWVLMHTAQISGGNSGGPLITEEGAVVGLNTYGFGENWSNMNRYCAVYIDYAIDGLKELGIPYELFGEPVSGEDSTESAETDTEETDTTESGEDKGGNNDDDEESWLIPLLVAGGALVVAAVVAAIVIIRKKKQQEQERERQRREELRRRQEAELRAQEAERRAEEERRRREEAAVAQIQLNRRTIYPVPAAGCIIGRDYDCTIRLPENAPGVSHRHCKLEFYQGQLILTDLQSTYGTFIHGKRIPANTPVALKPGSSFCLGSEQYKFTVC